MSSKFFKWVASLFIALGICFSMTSCFLTNFSDGINEEIRQRDSVGMAYFSNLEIKGVVKRVSYLENRKIYLYSIVLIEDYGNPLKVNPTNLFVYHDEAGERILEVYQHFNPTLTVGKNVCKDKGKLYFQVC